MSKLGVCRQKVFAFSFETFSLAAMQLASKSNVAQLVGARTTFEPQPISIQNYSLRSSLFSV